MADSGDSVRTPLRHATYPGVWGFVRKGPTSRVSDAAGVGGHARARRNDAMRVDAPLSVASSEHSRLAAVTGAGACGTVPLGGIGATPGGDADDVSCTDEQEAPGTSTALRARRGPTGARLLSMAQQFHLSILTRLSIGTQFWVITHALIVCFVLVCT